MHKNVYVFAIDEEKRHENCPLKSDKITTAENNNNNNKKRTK